MTALKLAAEGDSSRRIAEILERSEKTAGKHRASMMAKLGLRNAAGLTAYAIVHGLLH
jgi:DNA-binding CsgD family transcriptional regulator